MIQPAHPESLPPARPSPVGGAPAKGELTDFTVHLDRVFHGPLDLLLQLVRDQELEIHVVSLADVCDGYCQYVRTMPEVDVDEAADYLVVAATLLAVKSRSLLPQEEVEDEEDLFDPGEELVQQLLLYKELRQASEELGVGYRKRGRLYAAGGRWLGRSKPEEELAEDNDWDLGDVSIWDLLKVFQRLEKETGFMRPHRVQLAGRPLSWYVEEVWSRLSEGATLELSDVFSEKDLTRTDAAYYLVALLELAKQEAIDLRQDKPFGSVHVQRAADVEDVRTDHLDEEFDQRVDELEPELESLLEEPRVADSADDSK